MLVNSSERGRYAMPVEETLRLIAKNYWTEIYRTIQDDKKHPWANQRWSSSRRRGVAQWARQS